MSTVGQTRTLHVKFDNWKWRKATIFDSDEKTELYRVEFHLRNPQIILQSPTSDATAPKAKGDATFHALTSRIDIKLHDHAIELTSRGVFKDGYSYVSPALNGAKMTWESKNKLAYFDLVCLDETAMPVGRISLASWKVTKVGTIELVGDKVVNEGLVMDEVVMTGLAMMQHRLTTYDTAVAAH